MDVYISPSHIVEYLYCPRFTYFELVLAVPQREELRFKVMKGREVHHEREKVNPHYLRRRLGVVARRHAVEMSSAELRVKGIVDEVLELADGTMAPLDYKFAEDTGHLYENRKMQSVLYGLLIRDVFGRDVRAGYLCYVRSEHKIEEIPFTADDFAAARQAVDEVFAIIQQGAFPQATRCAARCEDCTYRNLCVQ
ncbi:MAG: CRISPR-associated protein Cas4 [Candidatus Schekmanbacteria bacterium]|nr:CRISPR-associated protein Cas4 [Candidatus Schekmanbacteria bacterium]